jgi:hypothetical protein
MRLAGSLLMSPRLDDGPAVMTEGRTVAASQVNSDSSMKTPKYNLRALNKLDILSFILS